LVASLILIALRCSLAARILVFVLCHSAVLHHISSSANQHLRITSGSCKSTPEFTANSSYYPQKFTSIVASESFRLHTFGDMELRSRGALD
jgi:hypothetical protein